MKFTPKFSAKEIVYGLNEIIVTKPSFSVPADDGTGRTLDVMYLAPGHEIIKPAEIEALPLADDLMKRPHETAKYARVSPTVMVKYGAVTLVEAKTLLFLAETLPSLPVPKLYAAYTCSPPSREIEGAGGSTHIEAYLIMECIEGETLLNAWDKMDAAARASITSELRALVAQWRSIPAPSPPYIGSVDHGPSTELMLWQFKRRGRTMHNPSELAAWLTLPGPFPSVEKFERAVLDAYTTAIEQPLEPDWIDLDTVESEDIFFTHGFLHPTSVIVKDGHVTGIIDWGGAGWYPEDWEFAKADSQMGVRSKKWASLVCDIMKAYPDKCILLREWAYAVVTGLYERRFYQEGYQKA